MSFSQKNAFPSELAAKLFPLIKKISTHTSISVRVSGLVALTKQEFEALPKEKQTKENKKRKLGTKSLTDIARLSFDALVNQYPVPTTENGRKAWSGLAQARMTYEALKGMKCKDSGMQGRVETSIEKWYEILRGYMYGIRASQNLAQKADRSERSKEENWRAIDLSEALLYSLVCLQNVEKGVRVDWRDVVFSLALTTGRRMAEILYSAKFSPVENEDYKIKFSGQLKTDKKGIKALNSDGVWLFEVEHTIGTLVPARLVIAGLDYLGENGLDKRKDSAKKVNENYSRYISEYMQKNLVWKLDDEFVFHGFRGAYVAAEMMNQQVSPQAYTNFALRALCDSAVGATEAYIRFDLAPGSLTRV